MTAPRLSPLAELVRQLDPDLFHAALFAPEPVRERLMVLYAYDIELSKAALRRSEPLIAQMRLQWWRDLMAGIMVGDTPRRHEIAGPLHDLVTDNPLPADDLACLIDAREIELEEPPDDARFGQWIDGRFGALTRLAVHLLVGQNDAARRAATAVGQAVGVAFTLRMSMRLAAEANQYLLPGLEPQDRAELARGRETDRSRAIVIRLCDQTLAQLAAARAERRAVPKAAAPALLPVLQAECILKRRQLGHPEHVAGQGARTVTLAWRALLGRW